MEPHHNTNIIVEANIPFIQGLLEPYAAVSYLHPGQITPQVMRSADAIITRTRTRCDASLLSGSRCSMIASATIGLDHVDLEYCQRNGIEVANAPGCNAPAVAQYVFASIIAAYGPNLSGLTLGIVGVGNVGKIVEQWARTLGMRVLLSDPPRATREPDFISHSLTELAAECHIITFHTPHTLADSYPTHHLASANFFAALKHQPMIINAARGGVVDTQALLHALDSKQVSRAVIDCWEGEPHISRELLGKAYIATPHIAGYSRQGKIRATQMAVAAVCRHFAWPLPTFPQPVPQGARADVTAPIIARSYNPFVDTENLRLHPEQFESLRNRYDLRSEV